MEHKELILEEIKMLRDDLNGLKQCQLQYFSLSITATGGILGLSAILETAKLEGLALLAPLVIILPCWVIFFDKATTIARLIGYQQILEEILRTNPHPNLLHLGYENDLSRYRSNEEGAWAKVKDTFRPPTSVWALLVLRTRHRYWMINYYTFAILALLCCGASYTTLTDTVSHLVLPLGIDISGPERALWAGTAFGFVVLCGAYTFRIVLALTRGRFSFQGSKKIWTVVLVPEPQGDA